MSFCLIKVGVTQETQSSNDSMVPFDKGDLGVGQLVSFSKNLGMLKRMEKATNGITTILISHGLDALQ